MGNKLVCINKVKVKTKLKIKSDFANNFSNVVNVPNVMSANASNVSLDQSFKEESINYDFEGGSKNSDGDNDTKSDTESMFIQKELAKFESSDCDEEETEDNKNGITNRGLKQVLKNESSECSGDKDNTMCENKNSDYDTKQPDDALKCKLFKNQDINEIRKQGTPFVDDVFKANILACISSPQSEFGKTLCQSFRTRDMQTLNKHLLWKKIQVF